MTECVITAERLAVPAERIWQSLLTYEEVRERPAWWLRLLIPRPLGTEGDKTVPGTLVRCRYETGSLMKRITRVEPPGTLEFEVVDQRIGLEPQIVALGGGYRIAGGELVLETRYESRLRPRWFWRPIEAFVAHAFHRHILRSILCRI
jgi:hypothetical protein